MQVLLAAIGVVGDDSAKVAAYLHQNSFDTTIGQVSWNRQGDLTAFDFQVFERHQDGSRTRVNF